MDLVDAFIDIGLPGGPAEHGTAADYSGGASRSRDANAPAIDQLQRYYLMSRGMNAPSSEGG